MFQENIKANKQKIGALSEVKEELATQLQERNLINLNVIQVKIVNVYCTVCLKSLVPLFKVTYYMKWVKPSWTYSRVGIPVPVRSI